VFFIEPAVNPPSPEMRPTVVKILSRLLSVFVYQPAFQPFLEVTPE